MLRKSSLLFAAVLIVPLLWALPNIIIAKDSDGEATVTLRLLQGAITGDLRNWCEVRIHVTKGATDPNLTTGSKTETKIVRS